jgi:hypothetical protein
MEFQSPNAMARAAYEDAVAQIKNGPYGGEGNHGHCGGGSVEMVDRGVESVDSKRERDDTMLFNAVRKNSVAQIQHDDKAVTSRIEDIWRSSSGTVDTKISQTMETILTEIDSLVAAGLGAFYDLDATTRQLSQSKELAENRAREAKRLASIDEQSRTTLSVSGARRISFP